VSEVSASIPLVNRTGSRTAALLPPVTLTPEEAAAVAVALAGRTDGPFADAGRDALEKVLAVLEPDPRRRAEILAAGARSRHPAGRARGAQPAGPQPPRLVLLPGGRG
jgi:predicted DNA-binding transcriptional regulator YafY